MPASNYEPTTEELQRFWKDAGLWRFGQTYEDAKNNPTLMKVMTRGVQAVHETQTLPTQTRLNLE